MKVVSVVGARPQFVKLAPIARALRKTGLVDHRIIHTGQHYDDQMSAVFFNELDIPEPDVDLGVGSASHGIQTAGMLVKIEQYLLQNTPSVVVVYGDTNSTLAATLAATKMNIRVAHIEAGLRSHNRQMPEEINRVTTDHCSDRLYAPTLASMENLEKENLTERSILVGDVMRDSVIHNYEKSIARSRILNKLNVKQNAFALLTLHRPVNTDTSSLSKILSELNDMALRYSCPLVFPVHPGTRAVLNNTGGLDLTAITLIEPVAYLDMLQLIDAARFVVTDSGGLQKEAAFLSTGCITLREETEWSETVAMGINSTVGQNHQRLNAAYENAVNNPDLFTQAVLSEMDNQYGRGNAAELIVQDLVGWLSEVEKNA